MSRNTQVNPIHFVISEKELSRTLSFYCGALCIGDGSEFIELVTCKACRQKYFGAAGVDPQKHASSITD